MKEKFFVKTRYGEFRAVADYSKKDKVYHVHAPAFPGILTNADTLGEAKRYAREIIELQCLAAFDDGKVVIDDMNRIFGVNKRPMRAGVVVLA
ncbi:MAG: hypothetical protein AAB421_04730 [Patescibacteria group bacterium]